MSTTPTRDEILKLPRWARVAFAARCAARVQPRYRGNEAFAIDQAIKFASFNAALGHAAARTAAADDAIAADAAAARSAAAAARSADAAARSADVAATAAAVNAVVNAAAAAAVADNTTSEFIRDDYQRLLQVTGPHDNRDAVDHWKLLGPLWPDGSPQWFLEGSRWLAEQLGHPLYRDDGMPWDKQPGISDDSLRLGRRINQSEPAGLVYADFIGEFTEDEYELCLEYLSEVYRETGGLGLKVVHSESLGFVPSEVSNDD